MTGFFVRERHGNNTSMNCFDGWWGHNKERRFLIENTFNPMQGVEGWQLSNAPVMCMAILKAFLDIFDDAVFRIYFNQVLTEFPNVKLEIITPADPLKRGAQLSKNLLALIKVFLNNSLKQVL